MGEDSLKDNKPETREIFDACIHYVLSAPDFQSRTLQEPSDSTHAKPRRTGRGLQIYRSRKGNYMVLSMVLLILILIRKRRTKIQFNIEL
jgi:hypothetical protein